MADLTRIIDERIAAALSKLKVKDLPVAALKGALDDLTDTDGDAVLQAHSVGTDALGVMPAVRVRRFAVKTIANATVTLMDYGSAEHDTAGMSNSSASRLLAPVDGLYLVSALTVWAPNATGVRQTYFTKNSVAAAIAIANETAVSAAVAQCDNPVTVTPLRRGEYVETYVYQTSGGNLDVTDAHMTMTFLSNYIEQ